MLPSFKAPLLSKVGLRLSEEYGCRQYRPHRAFPLYLSSYLARRLFPRSQRSSAALTGASGVSASATMIQEIEFAPDSPLEGDGFELPVPRGSDALLALRRELLGQKHRLLKHLTSPTPARLDVALLRGEVGRIRAVEGQC
jgi:hypothetical protein